MAALGLGLGLSKHSSYTLGSAFDPDYQAVLDYATANAIALPDEANQTIQNARLIAWKEAGIWATRDFVFHFEGSNAKFALIDWKRLTLATAVNSPTYDATKGFASNGTSSYIDLNYNPSTFGGNWSINDGGVLSKYVGDASFLSTHRAICSGSSGNAYLVAPYNATNQGSARLGETSSTVGPVTLADAQGTHTMCASKTSIDRTPYIDGSARTTVAITPALASQSLWSLRTQTSYSPSNLFHVGILLGGSGITSGQASDFHSSAI